MLHALINNKLKEAFRNASFEPSEDSLTSSVFGLLQYLPAQTMWDLLRQSCGNCFSLSENFSLPEKSGELQEIQFWPRWSAKGKEISNSRDVEPDVFCKFDEFDLIIEAKKGDQSGQYEQQWINEINAYKNTYTRSEKLPIFIAWGGNESLEPEIITIKSQEHPVFKASWQNLINNIDKHNKECSIYEQKRLLSDIIFAFKEHKIFSLEWLETLNNNFNININSKNIFKLWQTH